MDMYMWSRESVWSGACTRVCPCVHVCVYVKESMAEMHLHGHKCVCAHLHRCLHMGVGWPSPGGMIPGMQSLLCLPTWGGKGGLLLDSLGYISSVGNNYSQTSCLWKTDLIMTLFK